MEKVKTSSSSDKFGIIFIIIFGIFTVILWQFPFGNYVLYPFTILGTWFHEMGHGLAAMVLGGSFHHLIIFANGSGMAQYSGELLFGNAGRGIIAVAGPLGPVFAGFIFITTSLKHGASRLLLLALGSFMILTVIVWVRSIFGIGMILFLSFIIIIISIIGSRGMQTITLQFMGVQAYASVYLSTGYLLSPGGFVGGQTVASDTMQIANYLFFPYWFWSGAIILTSLFFIVSSLKIVLSGK